MYGTVHYEEIETVWYYRKFSWVWKKTQIVKENCMKIVSQG